MQRPRYYEEKNWNVICKPWPRLPKKGSEVDSPVTESEKQRQEEKKEAARAAKATCVSDGAPLVAGRRTGPASNAGSVPILFQRAFQSISLLVFLSLFGYAHYRTQESWGMSRKQLQLRTGFY
ncbi:Protein of unknown function [Pyronema omphalodes CBS 100304]|uniref:Uncharacterized protein n=1 Tax=Pyronema omphalodes (strain CBS 100304) TaxID=1076935 RepID=U4LAG6_PYROM|nr:Protein of unknown function [Pyronema omphalodes CBS 100304]